MHNHATKTCDGLQHGVKRSHQKGTALTKINGALLLKWLVAFCVLATAAAVPVTVAVATEADAES